MKKILKKIVPKFLISLYHFVAVKFFQVLYQNPSEKMIVVGITGTKGKSTVANLLWSILAEAGIKAGVTSTANFRVGQEERPNPYHMTMPGPSILYWLIREMAKKNCRVAIVETTSEAIVQHRHRGINYDMVVFTNLAPEHIEAHGSLERYRAAKGKLFLHLNKSRRKFFGKKMLPKKSLIFGDDPLARYFLQFPTDEKITFGLGEKNDFVARSIRADETGVRFVVAGHEYYIPILGAFNAQNALAALAVARTLGIDFSAIGRGLARAAVPGRMEKIATPKPFTVIVDYAHEPKSMTALLETAHSLVGNGKIILLTGSAGGGRDKSRRAVLGELGAKMADFLVVANEDPYGEDPQAIIDEIVLAAKKNGKVMGKNLFEFLERRQGIAKALSLARTGDIVLIAGKGAEQKMMVGESKSIPWDDRDVVREELAKIK